MNPGAVPDCVAALETGLADAVLPEIVAHLDALARDGTEVEIDLRSLPMSEPSPAFPTFCRPILKTSDKLLSA